ncbi:class I SAM-dependent methyltransferase, partial [Nanoarchaeota archaeon]
MEKCTACLSENIEVFYSIEKIPVHSVLLLRSKEDAVGIQKGDLALACCKDCGFIFNSKFDPNVHSYSEDYNPTQAHSPTFNKFHRQLALNVIEKFGLRGKKVLEIGCGEGEFITALCELGDNTGVAFDPAYHNKYDNPKIEFVTDFYSEKYSDVKADFVCCKMTLE